MLNTDVDTFLNVAVSNDFVDDDTDGMWGNVVNDTSSSVTMYIKYRTSSIIACNAPMVVFVGHATLHGRVGLDVDDVSYAVVDEVCRESDAAMLWWTSVKSQ